MPELPELEVVCEVLNRRVAGATITAVEVLPAGGAIVVRDLTHAGFQSTLVGARIVDIARRGKFLRFTLDAPPAPDPVFLVINPKLTGRLRLAGPNDKRHAKTDIVFTLADGQQLHYFDQKTMGQVYLTRDLDAVPAYAGMGPEPFAVSLPDFRARLRPFRGEIKGILTRGEFVAGIGNAYADEILWAARLHPYRKCTQLTPDEIERLYVAMQSTLLDAIEKVRAEMGENIHLKPREFMAVHMKTGRAMPALRRTDCFGGRRSAHHQFLPELPARRPHQGDVR